MNRILFCLIWILICPYLSNAQKYQFKKYSIEEGLLSNDTNDMLQDKNNRIWVTTTSGISCFNGQTFKNYTTENGLASNLNFSLFEDSKGRIWVGSLRDGPSIIENGKARKVEGFDFKGLGSVNDFLEDEFGSIYLITTNGIVLYKDNSFTIIVKKSPEFDLSGLQKAAWFDENTIYITSVRLGVFKLSLSPLKIEHAYGPENGVNRICYSVKIDKAKNIWIGAYGGLYKISNNIVKYFPFDISEFDSNRVKDIYQESEDELYLSFEGNGLGIFNTQTETLELINEKQGLPSKYIYRSIKDTEGNHWMTSYGEGIIGFRDTSFKIYNDDHGLASKSVNSIVEWNDKIFVATDDGLDIIDDSEQNKYGLGKTPINAVTVSVDNDLLVATNTTVLKINRFNTKEVIDYGVYDIVFDDNERTYLFSTNKIKVVSKDSTFEKGFPRAIAITPIGDRFIIMRLMSLSQLKDFKSDSISGLTASIHSDFRSIDAIDKNQVMVGSTTKLYHILLKDNKFHYKVFDLSRFKELRQFRALKVDGNDLWLAGRDILSKVDLNLLLTKDSVVVKNFKTNKNFLGSDINFNSLLIAKDKSILASSFSGILSFNQSHYLENSQAPKLDIHRIYLFSEPFEEELYRSDKGIVLPYKKNYLSFGMEAITFTNPENVKFKYRMIGLRNANEWSLPTKETNAVFSYLPPGEYTFEFTADNGDDVWQLDPYQYSFIIQVPFWRTWIFWFFTLLFTAASALFFYYIKNKRERKRSQEFTQSLIKAQENERIRVARELHDSVGQKLMLLTKKTKALGNTDMENLSTSTLEELRSISRGLHPATLERLGPSGAIAAMIDEVDENTDIFFTHEIENINSLLSEQASLHLYRIIQEALNNIVKHAEAKSVTVSIKKKNSTIQASIEDNGKGFEYSDRLASSSSLGMKTLAERAKILNSKIEIKSYPGKGTTINLIIPI